MKAFVLGTMLLHGVMIAGVPQTPMGEKLTIIKGYLFLEVSINGQGMFRMMIDTGASSCSLTPQAARTAGLRLDHRVSLSTMGEERLVPATSDATVRVGSAEARGVEVLIVPLDGVRSVVRRVDGILGQNFLNHFVYLIDYRRKRLWLGEEATRRAMPMPSEILAERAQGRMVVPVVLARGTRPWKLIMDSGASDVMVRCGNACPPLLEIWDGSKVLTNAGNREVQSGLLEGIEVGGIRLVHVPVGMVEVPPKIGHADGVLPTRYFSAIYVDSANDRIRLTR